ncbi:hypothetical protein [Sphingomonas sp. G-3-2-10]|uniref:hypothetical protein n=1 Tax=Sphingomonas sp. G-3-2-10 TaxID=2728838 RepID=UPI00146F55FE|nr:hypothetical protein [Sphingomonas sp. G-3-2-10]NML07433.1 hypothetical protein [Sphingomonas sp. G-3-2-10]
MIDHIHLASTTADPEGSLSGGADRVPGEAPSLTPSAAAPLPLAEAAGIKLSDIAAELRHKPLPGAHDRLFAVATVSPEE